MISLLIPCCNQIDQLKRYLSPLLSQIDFGIFTQIIIVDDASHDGSSDYISSHFPDIHLIINKEFLGFARSLNRGFFVSKNKLVLILPPFGLIKSFNLEKLQDFTANKNKAILLPYTYTRSSSQSELRCPDVQVSFQYGTLTINKRYARFREGETGLCLLENLMLLKKEIWEENDGFCTAFFPIGFELCDMALKIRKKKLEISHTEALICEVMTSSDLKSLYSPTQLEAIHAKNELLLFWRHGSGFWMWILHLLRLLSAFLLFKIRQNRILFLALRSLLY